MLVALRTGSGEAVQSIFPLVFVFLFLSCSSLPRDLIQVDWFRTIATYNPVSYIVEAMRAPLIYGWDWEALALGLRHRGRGLRRLPDRRDHGPAHQVDAHVSTWTGRAPPVRHARSRRAPSAWRYLTNIRKNPAFLLPPLIFPIFFLIAFAGGLSAVGDVPDFDYPDYTAFQFAFVLLQSSAFAGVFAGFTIAADFEFGFARRLLLGRAAARRGSSRATRSSRSAAASSPAVLIGGLAMAGGMEVNGSPSTSPPCCCSRCW